MTDPETGRKPATRVTLQAEIAPTVLRREVVDAVADGKRAAQAILKIAEVWPMPDIRVHNFAGRIDAPNPFLAGFWLRQPIGGEQIMRAFDAGWGGAVWKTIGEPVDQCFCSRYSATDWNGLCGMMGLNNIELISDRSVEENPARDGVGEEAVSLITRSLRH